jgi:hypothetical protein
MNTEAVQNTIKVEVDRNAHKCETLLEAMQDVLEASENCQFSKPLYRNEEWAGYAFDFLNERLGLSDEESILSAIILEEGTDSWATLSDISKHIGCSKIEVMQRKSVFDSLSKKGFIIIDGKSQYGFSDEVFQSISRNESNIENGHVFDTNDGLFSEIQYLHKRAYRKEISTFTLHLTMDKLLACNSQLPLVKGLSFYRKILNELEFRFLITLALGWVDNEDALSVSDVDYIFYDESSRRELGNSLISGKSRLITEGVVECSCDEGLAIYKGYALTNKAKMRLDPDLAQKRMNESVKSKLMSAKEISSKSLFYNDDIARQVSELGSLLKEKQLRGVLTRLKERNLRCGFTCLFHGGPGTGKTETVYQLARQTGRDIFQVDYSQLRSKWVGDSEKNVKAMFDEYRQLCKTAKLMPILLLNEADALIGKRMESAERAVDKGENALQNIVLQEMEVFDGILIATTNLAENMDSAFERRFLYKIEFEKPDTEARAKIWKSMLPSLNKKDATTLSERFPRFVGGQIENITRKVTVSEVLHGGVTKLEDIVSLCEHETIGKDTPNKKSIGFQMSQNN